MTRPPGAEAVRPASTFCAVQPEGRPTISPVQRTVSVWVLRLWQRASTCRSTEPFAPSPRSRPPVENLLTRTSWSQTSPKPSPSESDWVGLASFGQLSEALGTPSPSRSGSHASPTPSPSRSLWVGFATVGQLSEPVQKVLDAAGLQTPSRSESTCAREQPLASTVAPADVPGQASFESNTPSASLSATETLFEAALGLAASSSARMAK